MNGLIKWLLRTAAIFFGVGALLGLGGWALGGQTRMEVNVAGQDVSVGIGHFTFSRDSVVEYGEEQSANDVTAFNEVDIDVSLGDVHLVPSDSYGVSLAWSNEEYTLKYTNEGGKLKVWSSKVSNIGFPFGNDPRASVTITYPSETQFSKVNINTALGTVDLSGFSANSLDLTASLGDVRVAGVSTEKGTMELSMGSLWLEEITADKLELSLSLGELEAYGLTTAKKLTVENHMGKTWVQGAFGGETDITSNMGDVTVTTNLPQEDYGYDLYASMGKIKVDGITMDEEASRRGGPHSITVDNSMGKVTLKFE